LSATNSMVPSGKIRKVRARARGDSPMSIIKAVVRKGKLETERPIDLPDGTELLIPIAETSSENEEGWDNTPEGVAAWLKWYDSLEPLIFTEAEKAAWE